MKATLEFSLPEEAEEFATACDATKWKIVVGKIDEYLRRRVKYAEDDMSPEALEAYASARDALSGYVCAAELSL